MKGTKKSGRKNSIDYKIEKQRLKWEKTLNEKRSLFSEMPRIQPTSSADLRPVTPPVRYSSRNSRKNLREDYEQRRRIVQSNNGAPINLEDIGKSWSQRPPASVNTNFLSHTLPKTSWETRDIPRILHGSHGPSKAWKQSMKRETIQGFASPFHKEDWEYGPEGPPRKSSVPLSTNEVSDSESEGSLIMAREGLNMDSGFQGYKTQSQKFFELYHQMSRQKNIVLRGSDLAYFHEIAHLEFDEDSLEPLDQVEEKAEDGSPLTPQSTSSRFSFSNDPKLMANLEFVDRGSSSPRHTYVRNLIAEQTLPPLLSLLGQGEDTIDLSHKSLGDQYINLLADIFDKLPAIRVLNLRDNRLTDTSVHQVIETITTKEGCRFLEVLDLSENKLDVDSIHMFVDFLRDKACPLKELYLASADLDDKETHLFASSLEDNRSVVKLDLSHNTIGGSNEKMKITRRGGEQKKYDSLKSGGLALAEALRMNNTLTYLNLSWNCLGVKSAEALGAELKLNNCLKELHLAYNSLGDAGGQALGHMLEQNVGLEYLDLSNNVIKCHGAAVLALGLEKNPNLRVLKLDGNAVGRSGGRALMRSLQCMNAIDREISLKGCTFGGSGNDSQPLVKIGERPNKKPVIVPFDPIFPMGEYHLKLENKYEHYVASELVKLAALLPGCSFKSLQYWDGISRGGGHKHSFEKIYLERPLHMWPMDPEIGSPSSPHAYKQWFNSELRRFSNMNGKEAHKEMNEFRMTLLGSGDVYVVPDRGQLKVEFSWVPQAAAPHNVINSFALELICKMLLDWQGGDRLEFMALFSKDTYFICSQVQYLINKVNASKSGFNAMQMVEVFVMLLPQVLDPENLKELLNKNLDDEQQNSLKQRLGPVYHVTCGLPSRHYSLDLAKETHRLAALRLAQLNKWETLFMRHLSGWDYEDGGTAQNGNWMNFRNAFYKGKKGKLTDRFYARVLPTTNLEPLGMLEVDFVSTIRAPPGSSLRALRQKECANILKSVNLTWPGDEPDAFDKPKTIKSLNLAALMSLAIIFKKEAGSGKRKLKQAMMHAETFQDRMNLTEPARKRLSRIKESFQDTSVDFHKLGEENLYVLRVFMEEKLVGLVQHDPPLLIQHILLLRIIDSATQQVLVKIKPSAGEGEISEITFHTLRLILNGVKPVNLVGTSALGLVIEKFGEFVDEQKVKIVKRRSVIQRGYGYEWLVPNEEVKKLDRKSIIHYYDAFVKDLPNENFQTKIMEGGEDEEDEEEMEGWEYTWLPMDEAEQPKIADEGWIWSLLELQDRLSFSWLTCETVATLASLFPEAGPDGARFKEELIVSLFSRVVDLENFHTLLTERSLTLEGQLKVANRLGWLNVLNVQHIDRHYDLDLSFKDHWKLANLITFLSVREDGENLPERHFSRKMEPHHFIPGWDLPKSWDEETYEKIGNIKPGVPIEGHFVFKYWSKPNADNRTYAYARVELRQKLARQYTLLGMPQEYEG